MPTGAVHALCERPLTVEILEPKDLEKAKSMNASTTPVTMLSVCNVDSVSRYELITAPVDDLRHLYTGGLFVMVQLYYYENRGRCARKLLRHDGYSGSTPGSSKTRVLLFPYEGWAQPAAATYWLIKTVWWSRTRCKIVEVSQYDVLLACTVAKWLNRSGCNLVSTVPHVVR